MYEEFTRVEIAGEEHPIKCDVEVLAALQDKFGTLNAFERLILGLEEVKEFDGKQKLDDEGNPLFLQKEPSYRAILAALPLMLHSGYRAAIKQGIAKEEPDLTGAIFDAEFSHIETAVKIHDEFRRCYARKNRTAPKRGRGAEKRTS